MSWFDQNKGGEYDVIYIFNVVIANLINFSHELPPLSRTSFHAIHGTANGKRATDGQRPKERTKKQIITSNMSNHMLEYSQ